jgi:hypothetical protein
MKGLFGRLRRHVPPPVAAVAALGLVLALAAFLSRGISAAGKPDLGPNVFIFEPSMPAAAIQETTRAGRRCRASRRRRR